MSLTWNYATVVGHSVFPFSPHHIFPEPPRAARVKVQWWLTRSAYPVTTAATLKILLPDMLGLLQPAWTESSSLCCSQ